MLRCILVGDGNGFIQRFYKDYFAVFERFAGCFFSRKFFYLYFYLPEYFVHQIFGRGDQYGLTVGAVFCL